MPRRPDLIDPSDDPRPKFTMSGMGIVVQGDVGGLQFALEQHIDATADEAELNSIADRMRRMMARQKAWVDLGEKSLALQIAQERVADAPERKLREQKALADEKARLRASFEIAHDGTGKRGEFRLSGPQAKALESFDERIQATGMRIEAEAAQMKADIPLIEKQIERLRAIIDGPDPAETEAAPRLAEAAE